MPQNSAESNDLLRLPRELRDLIYTYILVKPDIQLESAVVSAAELSDWMGEEVRSRYPIIYPHRTRSTWTQRECQYPKEEGPGVVMDDEPNETCMSGECHHPDTVLCTYQIRRRQQDRRMYTEIFLTNRQIYLEASEIFYGKNLFCFREGFCIATALHFLKDRPIRSLSHIRSLELHLMEWQVEDFRDRPPNQRTFLVYAERFPALCNFISSNMSLKHFHLVTCDYLSRFPDPSEATLPLYLEREKDENMACVPSWLESLLLIQDLETMTVCFSGGYTLSPLRQELMLTRMRYTMLRNCDREVIQRFRINHAVPAKYRDFKMTACGDSHHIERYDMDTKMWKREVSSITVSSCDRGAHEELGNGVAGKSFDDDFDRIWPSMRILYGRGDLSYCVLRSTGRSN